MTKQFTTPCFIQKNTHELRAKLKEIGYCIHVPNEATALAIFNNTVHGYYLEEFLPEDIIGFVDCGENEALFLALAAMNNSDDKDQWFIRIDTKELYLCKVKKFKCAKNIPGGFYRKATVPEIIEHFKTKEK